MKRRFTLALVMVLIITLGCGHVMATKRPKTMLDVTILNPQSNIVVESDSIFGVTASVLAQKGDAGLVETYIQYAVGEGSTDFANIDDGGATELEIKDGNQPQIETLLNGQSCEVSWTLKGVPGTYEIRVFSQGSTAKSGFSETRTVTIRAPSPPPETFFVTSEHQDTVIGFGSSVGSFAKTFSEDGFHEVLIEEKNDQGTKKPIDDTTELGWVFEFSGVETRPETTLYLKGYAEFPADDTDVLFEVQLDSDGVWEPIISIRNTEQDMLYAADIPDDISDTVRIRVVDDDQTVGNKVVSLLYLDCLWISSRTFQYDSSGQEILVSAADDRCIYVWEDFRGAWMQESVIHTEQLIFSMKIADLNGDGVMEALVGEDEGVIEIFENQGGLITRTQRLVHPYLEEALDPQSPWGNILLWVNDIVVGDLDNDESRYLELLTTSDQGRYATIWKMGDTTYEPIFNITLPADGVAVGAGDLDNDNEIELVVSACVGMPGIVMIYEYQGDRTWEQSTNYTDFTAENSWIDHIEICDVDNDDMNDLVVENYAILYVFDYVEGELVKKSEWGNHLQDRAVNFFACGNLLNEIEMQIIAVDLNQYEEDAIIFFETVDGQIINTFNISSPIELGYIALGNLDGDDVDEYVISGSTVLTIWCGETLCHTLDTENVTMGFVAIGDYDNDAVG